ncbi:MAG: hypothetical protein SGJ24_06435 [Chloroflexota bacterium]|nr:hypothetical protein [Chloroflexota bacterium]
MSAGWKHALVIGFTLAVAHRLALTVWLAVAWGVLGSYLPDARADFHATADARLPVLTTPAEAHLLGVWRRWDAVHYLDLAHNGYRTDQAGSTVFGVLTPMVIAAVAPLVGGSVDVASIIVQTLAFGAALTLLIRLCAVWFDDQALGVAGAITTALLPLSFYFAAPMSESIYLALVLGTFYLAVQRRWLPAALLGCLATLTRAQGAVMAIVVGLLLIEAHGWRWAYPASWLRAGIRALPAALLLLLIPAGYLLFVLYRDSIGLPSLGDTYANYSYHFFVNPIEGVWINLVWIANNPARALVAVDVWFLFGSFLMAGIAFFVPKHRRLPLLAYTLLHLAVYIAKINWVYGTTDQVTFSQSFARYTLMLFPAVLLMADGARRLPRLGQVALAAIAGVTLLLASALYTVALIGP